MQSLLMFLAAVAASTGEDCTEDIRPYIQERIIGGIPAKVGEFPYIVFIRTVFGEGAYEFYRHCGGSIIAKDWVLTAAHCLEVNDCPRCSYQRSVLRAGSSYQEEGGIVRSSSTAITQTSSIGLLKVEEEWPLHGPCISPARLPREASLVPGGSPATIVGWGGIPVELVGRADLLKQQVEVISYKQCVSKYKEVGLLLHNTEMCTIFREGENVQLTWEKDVGCPVIVNDTVVGIVQGGNVGGSEVLPDVHVRVSAFIEWITTVTGGHLPFLSPDIH